MLPLSETELQTLAPAHLTTYRTDRYEGDGLDASLARFAPADRERLRRVYDSLLGMLEQLRDPVPDLARAERFAAENGWSAAVAGVRELGADTPGARVEPALRKVVHDLRGGAMQAIVSLLQLQQIGIAPDDGGRQLFFLVRDHLKMMRNALPDLDPERTARDRSDHPHDVELLVEKWREASYRLADSQAEVAIRCEYRGTIAERCLEFSALDRIIYNLVNNAVRNTADGEVGVTIFAPDREDPRDLRFVVANAVAGDQVRALESRFGDDLGGLFRGGFTTGGTGLGMSICAEFVMHAYGVDSLDEALGGRYVGARLEDDRFLAWFHWPTAPEH